MIIPFLNGGEKFKNEDSCCMRKKKFNITLPRSKTMSFGRLLHETASAIITISLSLVSVVTRREFAMSGRKNMVEIMDLPLEVLARIFMFLPAKDIANVSKVCRSFYEASHVESVWIYRCRQDYKITTVPCNGLSYRDIYTKILHQHGKLIGLWQPQVSSYGGLLEVCFEKGKIIATELHPPKDPNITEPLRRKPLFSITFNETGKLDMICTGGHQREHKVELSQPHENKFSFKCCNVESHNHPEGRHQGLMDWLLEEASHPLDLQLFPHSQELLLMKFLVLHQYNYSYQFRRINMPEKSAGVPIQPGLFKGTYGAHGLEIILLSYEENNTKVKALKISGDPNVPAGQVTFHVDLNYSMQLTEQQQQTITQLESLQITEGEADTKPSVQPFFLPVECFERFSNIPKLCIGRFHGEGQIAGHGFTNPSFSRGHWIVFSEDLFGFLWLDLLSLSMYHRVEEKLVY